jgi:hypothetical protein
MVLVLICGILFTVILESKIIWQAAANRAASRQDLQLSFWKIQKELKGSNVGTITIGSNVDAPAFSFISAYDGSGGFVTDEKGSPMWQKYVVIYVDEDTVRLLKKEIYQDFSDPASVKPLTAAELTSCCDGGGNVISSSVKSLTLTRGPEGKSLKVLLETKSANKQGQADSQSTDIEIIVYNN